MPGRLSGKVALITGAARSLGAAQAELLAAEGACVLLTDVLVAVMGISLLTSYLVGRALA